jgi:hypothetical protein
MKNMEVAELEKLRYPIGKFEAPNSYSSNDITKWIKDIEDLPLQCRNELKSFTDDVLEETYKPGGWTARQVIHHIPDSHLNAYIRFKLALTEDLPTIRPYFEERWANLPDGKKSDPEISLTLLESLHRRWVLTLKNMTEQEFERKYFHPESKKEFQLKTALALYSWHGRHHLEHIRIVKRKFASVKS